MNFEHRTEIARPPHYQETPKGGPCGELYNLFAGTASEEIEELLIALDRVKSDLSSN